MKRIYKNAFLPVLFLIFNISLNYAQDIEFIRVIPEDGTNFEAVNDITQDKVGFMWFSTLKGLFRYDGNQLMRFKNDSLNSNSIAANSTSAVYADSDGILWIGCRGIGLDRYDPKTGIFTHFKNDPNDSTSIASNSISKIMRDHEEKLWIGTSQGLDQFDPKTNSFIHFKTKKDDTTSLSDLNVKCLYEDKQGTLWVGTGVPWLNQDRSEPEYGGLNRYNRETGTFTQYKHKADDPRSLTNNKVFSIFEDNKGVLWVGTYENGLHQMDREKGTFKQMIYDPAHPETFGAPERENGSNSDLINFITQDIKGGYWLGKRFSGLFYFNPETGKLLKFNGSGAETSGFMDTSAMVAYTSRDGVLWIGGRDGNIYRVNLLPQKIPKPFVSTTPVKALYEEQDGTFWIGKQNDLLRVDKKTGDTLKFNTELKFAQDSVNDITDIKKDLQGTLWVAASTGLFKWDAVNHKFTGYHHDPENKNSLNNNNVSRIYEDSRHNFWVGTRGGLNLMDRNTGKFSHVNELPENLITTILEDKSGNVWIGSVFQGGGLRRFDPETKSFKTYMDGSSIMSVYEDSGGVLWAGQQNGLFSYDPEKDEFVPLGSSYAIIRLSNLHAMVEDNSKNLWINTRDAIVRLNQQRNETRVFGTNYSIERTSLGFRASLKGKNGNIYFGRETGYYQINPLDFNKNTDSDEIFFTRFLLFDKEIKLSKDGPLKEPLQEAKAIKLEYDQNVFSIDFTRIDYIHPEEIRLSYFLENYDNNWIPAYTERQASYFNVPPGRYVFRIKGPSSNGDWTEKKIEIIILPPWYRTWLAYAIYALLFITAVFAFDRFMRRRIVQRERQKSQKRELAQAKEIEKAYTELKSTQAQLIQSEKMASLGELTAGIAHEIQNPLNFVNNFSDVSKELAIELKEEVLKSEIDKGLISEIAEDIVQNQDKIHHHGQRASDIVKGMLQHSRTSTGQKELTDINALADEYLRLAYHGLRAKDKSFNADFKTEFDESLPKINVIPQDIGRVLLNLINNAFYAVSSKTSTQNKNYKPIVTVSTKINSPSGGGKGKETVQITVSDNGPGIPSSIVDKIFQPFFTTKPTGSGTGLGLSLSYDIVKAHGGEITVESRENEGTEFIITIPIKS